MDMKVDKEIIEERINNSIKDTSKIVGYCMAKAINFPYPGFLNPLGLVLLAFLSAEVSRVFLFLFVVFLFYLIKTAVWDYEKYILVFLQESIKLLRVKDDNLNVVNIHTYSYRNVESVATYASKNFWIILTNKKSIKYYSTIQSTNSSFTLKDFDVKKFCDEKKTEKDEVISTGNETEKQEDISTVNDILPKILDCPSCGDELELEENERISKQFTCPWCDKFIDLN